MRRGAMKQLAAVQLAGNALALWLGYYWLSVGEARTSLLLWSVAVALFTAALFVWIHGAALAFSRDPYGSPFPTALRHLPLLLVAAAVVLALYLALNQLQDLCRNPATMFASWLTLKTRKPVKPSSIIRAVAVVFWLIRWVAIPILLLPAIRSLAAFGVAGLRSGKRLPRTWMERALTPVLLLIALWLPLRILAWHPVMSAFWLEMVSFALRVAVAYLLFTAGLFTLEGMPVLTQRSRLPSP